ncbi:uncharacterized protein LOC131943956 isoform X2 [Physella acuta]|nr:uncharacterized protein LOC131943956 isoform X2 [Physella acuta]XP_059160341.1 uncharacterized protein LOC131943956 isoform X2 [Physella acuta]XP_059160342.1 uncharacterized protein LOC131943956 isoform X2 [Physella acuta]XP_059160343.1 uncharacterized protein LOC131943956 isoform X2 [Physella acuta]
MRRFVLGQARRLATSDMEEVTLLTRTRHQQLVLRHASTSSSVSPDNIIMSERRDIHIPRNLAFHQYFYSKCDEFKDITASEDFLTGRKYTFLDLKEKSIKVASALTRKGYRKGDVVLAFTPNTIDFTVLMLACAATGLWFSAANPAFTAEELSRQLNDCSSKAIFTIPAFATTVKDALNNKQFPNKVQDLFVFGECPGFQPFQSLIDDDGKAFPDVDINPVEDVFTLPYSSGTTGMPKGVMLTHYNCLANCLQVIESVSVGKSDRCLGLLPLYHIYGMTAVQFAALQTGASLQFLPKFEPETFLRCLQDKQITLAHLVPPLIVFLAKHPLVAKYDLSALKMVISGAAPLGVDITQQFQQRFEGKIVVNQGYGMTETTPVTNVDTTATPGSIGNMVVNTLGKIVDVASNQALGPGEVGEYCVKGPQVMKGYFKNKKATDDMIEPDGWLHTGDIGYYNKDGLVFIKDRLKELIKYKGSQVPPAELEALLLGHPDVQDVAVIGVPDDQAGELPKAFVVKKPGSKLTEKEVARFVEERVSHTKKLRGGVQFVEDIPKNPSGKILRRVLREKYL